MKLSNRLKSICKYIDKVDVVADIGCDHALLDIYLIKNKYLDKIYACDINKNALDSGIKNIKKYHLEKEVIPVLCDGIEAIDSEVNTLIISGMGSSTIIKILSSDRIKQIDKLVIQSNNDYYLLRKYLSKNNFYIKDEEFIEDNNKYYVNIVFIRGDKVYSDNELKYGPVLIRKDVKYFNYLLNKQMYILSEIPKGKIRLRFKVYREIFKIKRIIKKQR